ncbi:MAG: T9SS type A sorting domain-containing protein, partial [Saprospiraceae bacterium]|nr:T9SS type A sorting domain-containing protein [Saprospiraceae bacterium]
RGFFVTRFTVDWHTVPGPWGSNFLVYTFSDRLQRLTYGALPPDILPDVLADTTLCLGDTLTFTAASLPYFNTLWSNGATGTEASFTHPGVYEVKIESSPGCAETAQIILDFCDDDTFHILLPMPFCGGANLETGVPGASYLWSTGATSQSTGVDTTGWYAVQLTMPNGSVYHDSVFVEVHENDLQPALASTPTCHYDSTGIADLTVQTESDSLAYFWSNGATTEDVFNLPEGPFSVSIMDEFGCWAYESSYMPYHTPELNISWGITQPSLSNNDGSIHVTIHDGAAPVTVDWSNGATGPNLSGLAPGCYSFTVTDGNGCALKVEDLCLDSTISQTIEPLGKFLISAYPNPTERSLTFKFSLPVAEVLTLQIVDPMGRAIRTIAEQAHFAVGDYQYQINVHDWPPGVYTILLITDHAVFSQRIVKI